MAAPVSRNVAWLAGAVVAAVVGIGAFWALRAPSGGPPASPPHSGETDAAGEIAEPLALRFPASVERIYSLELSLEQRHVLIPMGGGGDAPPPLRSVTRLEVELAVRGHGPIDGGWRAGIRVVGIGKYDVEMGGKPLFPDVEAVRERVMGHEAIVQYDAAGRAVQVAFAEGAPPLFENLVQLVLAETRVVLEPGRDAWSDVERTWHGTAETASRVVPTESGVTVARTRAAYATVDEVPPGTTLREARAAMKGDARIDTDGAVTEYIAEETVDAIGAGGAVVYAARSEVRWTLARVQRFDPEESAAAVARASISRAPGQVARSADAERDLLLQQAAGLTATELLDLLRRFGPLGEVPDHSRFLWRAQAVLQLHPELAGRLAELALDPGMTLQGRELILDLLVNAETPEANAALCHAVDGLVAEGAEGATLLLQRLGLSARPDGLTLATLDRHFQSGDVATKVAAAASLGALAGRMAASGDAAGAQAIGDQLTTALDATEDPKERGMLLRALGNAALPEHEGLIADEAARPHPELQRSAARALRHYDTPRSRGTLVQLASGAHPLVQQAALESLRGATVGSGELEALLAAVQADAVDPLAYGALVNSLLPELGKQAGVRAIFEAILTKKLDDDQVQIRIRTLLE
jgi:hypothetical protein